MKFCQKHLKQTVDTFERECKDTPLDAKSLMAVQENICGNALHYGGSYILGKDDEGNEYCPLCELVKHTKNEEAPEQWILGSIAEQKQIKLN